MTFWSGERLSTDGAMLQIVDPFEPGRIDCSAYTLTLGAEAYVTPHFGDNLRESVKQDLTKPQTVNIGGVSKTRGGGKVVIPPGQFAFLLTEETVAMPNDAMGFISLKSKPKFGGLINVSGFHVDPGFNGKLIFSVFNAGPSALHFARGERLFLLWIADLSFNGPKAVGSALHHKTDVGYAEIPSDLVTRVARENHSLQSLSLRVETLTSRVTILSSVAAAMAVVFGLLAGWLALKPDDKIERHQVQVELSSGPTPTASDLALLPIPKPKDSATPLKPSGN